MAKQAVMTQAAPKRSSGKTFLGGYMNRDLVEQVEEIVKEDSSTVSQVIRTALVQFLKQRKASAA